MGRGEGLSGLRNTCAVLLPVALVAGLLGGTPAAAADDAESDDSANRQMIVELWKTGGSGVKAAAESALLGTDEDVKEFFTSKDSIQYDDDRIDAAPSTWVAPQ